MDFNSYRADGDVLDTANIKLLKEGYYGTVKT